MRTSFPKENEGLAAADTVLTQKPLENVAETPLALNRFVLGALGLAQTCLLSQPALAQAASVPPPARSWPVLVIGDQNLVAANAETERRFSGYEICNATPCKVFPIFLL